MLLKFHISKMCHLASPLTLPLQKKRTWNEFLWCTAHTPPGSSHPQSRHEDVIRAHHRRRNPPAKCDQIGNPAFKMQKKKGEYSIQFLGWGCCWDAYSFKRRFGGLHHFYTRYTWPSKGLHNPYHPLHKPESSIEQKPSPLAPKEIIKQW